MDFASGAADMPSLDLHALGFEWPEVEHFDYQHHLKTAHLACSILSFGFPEEQSDEGRRVLYLAGLLHEVDRTQPYFRDDPYCARRSAAKAEKVIAEDSRFHKDELLRSQVGRLVATLGSRDPYPDEILLRCLHDAEIYEAARFAPGTEEGHRIVLRETKRLSTDWAKERTHLRRYLVFRGWPDTVQGDEAQTAATA